MPNNMWESASHWSALITDLQRRLPLAAARTFPDAAPFSINECYQGHNIWTRFGLTMPAMKTAEWQARKGMELMVAGKAVSASNCSLLVHRREKSLKVQLDICRWFDIITRCHWLILRSIIIITTTAGSDIILSSFIIVCSASLHYTADNLGEISKLLVLCAEY